MFEFVTRRRFLLFLFGLISTIISIILISRLIPSYKNVRRWPTVNIKNLDTSDCYENEPADVLTLCQPCTSYEIRSHAKACRPTGYREIVLCSSSNIQTPRSCQKPTHIQARQFWLFEGFVFFLSLLSLLSVRSRQNTLDKQMAEKIRKQLGECDY